MRDKEYFKWLHAYVTNAVVVNYIKRCQRVEKRIQEYILSLNDMISEKEITQFSKM